MQRKTFLGSWLTGFVVIFGLNGVFHAQLAAPFFDAQLVQLQPAMHKMSDSNPFWVGLLDFLLTFGMTYFITLRQSGKIQIAGAAVTGALLNLMASGTWNFANAALFDWSAGVTLVDMIWHTALGAAGGVLIGTVYNRLLK